VQHEERYERCAPNRDPKGDIGPTLIPTADEGGGSVVHHLALSQPYHSCPTQESPLLVRE
jgi:hypothetical protein